LQQQQSSQQILTQPNLAALQQPLLNLQPSPVVDQGPPTATATAEPEPPAPKTSLVTVFVSGKSPGEFTKLTSTVVLDEKEGGESPPKEADKVEEKTIRKRSAESIQPSPTVLKRVKRSPQLQNILNPTPTLQGGSSSSTQNVGFLLPLPELPIDIFPRSSYIPGQSSTSNGRFTLFPGVFRTSTAAC